MRCHQDRPTAAARLAAEAAVVSLADSLAAAEAAEAAASVNSLKRNEKSRNEIFVPAFVFFVFFTRRICILRSFSRMLERLRLPIRNVCERGSVHRGRGADCYRRAT